MNKSNVLKFFSGLAFVISAAFSVINLWSMAYSIISKILSAGMGIVMEYGKVTSIYYAISDKKLPSLIRGILYFVYICLLVASISFSMSFINNEENENNNYSVKHSKQAQAQQDKINTDTETINTLKAQIEIIKANYNSAISNKQEYISSLPKNYITVKQNSLKELEILKKEMTNKVNEINNQIIAASNSKKSTLDKPVAINEQSTTGFTSMLLKVVNWHNSTEQGKENPWLLDQVQFVFYLILSIVFELLASLLWYLSEHKKENDPNQPQQQNNTNNNTKSPTINKTQDIQTSAKIGFVMDNKSTDTKSSNDITFSNKKKPIIQGISNRKAKAYIDAMYQSIRKDGKTIDGMNKIRLRAYDLYKVKISEPDAKKIYGYLENTEIIKPTDSKNTELLKDRSFIKI